MLHIALDSPSCISCILLIYFLFNLLFLFRNFVQFLSMFLVWTNDYKSVIISFFNSCWSTTILYYMFKGIFFFMSGAGTHHKF